MPKTPSSKVLIARYHLSGALAKLLQQEYELAMQYCEQYGYRLRPVGTDDGQFSNFFAVIDGNDVPLCYVTPLPVLQQRLADFLAQDLKLVRQIKDAEQDPGRYLHYSATTKPILDQQADLVAEAKVQEQIDGLTRRIRKKEIALEALYDERQLLIDGQKCNLGYTR